MKIIKTEIWDIVKRNFGIILVGTLFLILYFNGCGNNGKGGGQNTTDTVTHTTQVLQPIVVNQPYTPNQVGQPIYVNLPKTAQGVIPAGTMDSLVAQVRDLSARIEALGKQYYATKHYEDSIQLKDTAGKRVGVVQLKQTVSENTLQSTQPTYQLSFPLTERVITNTIYPKKRNQVFVGGGFTNNFYLPSNISGDVGMMLKNKRDNMLGASLSYNFTFKQAGARVSYYQLLSFKQRAP